MSNNESVFFGFKIGKTKHKLIKARDFLRFFEKLRLTFGTYFKKQKTNTRNYFVNQIIKYYLLFDYLI